MQAMHSMFAALSIPAGQHNGYVIVLKYYDSVDNKAAMAPFQRPCNFHHLMGISRHLFSIVVHGQARHKMLHSNAGHMTKQHD